MLILDIEYLSYICQLSLTVNNQLVNHYNQYIENNDENESLGYDFRDYELNNFLINLVDTAEYWTDNETAKNNDSLILSYFRMTDLIQYMHNINYLSKKHRTILEKTLLNYPQLKDFQLEDSRLVDLHIDSKIHFCNVVLENVLLYNDKRMNRSMPVDSGTLILTFQNTKKVEVKGEITIECHQANIVYKWHIMEISYKHICFCLLILNGNRCFILQITCSDILIETK
ncbi:MAG: hypothetical protein K0S01_2109 [Herbinix sp.]|jgi:hypothetical protein|nr:hypothetical protein [Herbinix sp.]